MLKNRSVATLDNPEFIDVKPYNHLISQCEIKVLYLGENRNGSYITKDVAIQMANSLPCAPIVGAWREDVEDFGDHGHVIKIEDGEVKFSCKTRPYGFVAPDAQIWFQKFIDTNEFGEEIEREYLMTTGYLWAGQYEEVQKALTEGQPQSMELDEDSLQGHWASNNSGMDFFIINDAVFSKLCILGDDVEPCFEGAAVAKQFTKDEEFTKTLFSMMNELKDALSYNEGGLSMEKEDFVEAEEEVTEFENNEVAEESAGEETDFELESEPEPEVTEFEAAEETEAEAEEEYAALPKEDDEEAKDEEESEDEEDEKKKPTENKKKKCGECSLSQEEYDAMTEELESLRAEVEELRSFKLQIVNEQKDALINKYHMLSVDDKKSIIEHKEEYSLEEIEAKLAVLYVEKNVNFDSVDGKFEEFAADEETEDPITTFSLDDSESTEVVPAFVEALRRNRQ